MLKNTYIEANMKAELTTYAKQYVGTESVVEIKIWRVNDKRYPHYVKYSLIFINFKTGEKVLMDNHYPKTPHIHINNTEINYLFRGVPLLIKDFKQKVLDHFGEKI